MDLPKRKSNRLKGYDYSSYAAYFVTVCTHKKENTLSHIRRDSPCGCPIIELTAFGKVVEDAVNYIEDRFNVTVDKYVIMPNHVHFILTLFDEDKAGCVQRERTAARAVPTLSHIVGAFKSKSAVDWLRICNNAQTKADKLWQRSFHDHIIRGRQDYEEIW